MPIFRKEPIGVPGNPTLICEECYHGFRRSDMITRYDGKFVCKEFCMERDQAQLFAPSYSDKLYLEHGGGHQVSSIPAGIINHPNGPITDTLSGTAHLRETLEQQNHGTKTFKSQDHLPKGVSWAGVKP